MKVYVDRLTFGVMLNWPLEFDHESYVFLQF